MKKPSITYALASLLLAACGQIEPELPTDEDGALVPLPPPYEDWLRVQAIHPVPRVDAPAISTRSTFAVTLNHYLNEESFRSYSAIALSTGGQRVSGQHDYIFSTRTLLFTPSRPLQAGLEYTLSLDLSQARSVNGAPTRRGEVLVYHFITSEDIDPDATELERGEPTWAEISTRFEELGCRACHGASKWPKLVKLELDQLVGARSTQADLLLVRRYDPADSYLLHKLLPEYPLRRFGAHPPTWADSGVTITPEDLWLIEQWISQGAK